MCVNVSTCNTCVPAARVNAIGPRYTRIRHSHVVKSCWTMWSVAPVWPSPGSCSPAQPGTADGDWHDTTLACPEKPPSRRRPGHQKCTEGSWVDY